jgi:hypothetical protein
MGIPLAALAINPPTPQANLLDQYSKVAQLKQMQQEAPLRQQALQQNVQSGQQEIAARQDALATQQATRAAYRAAVKPNAQGQPEIDTDELTKNLASSGHGDAIPGILDNVTKFQKSKADLQESQQKIDTYNKDTLGYAAKAIQNAKYDPNVSHTLLDTLPNSPQINALRQQIDTNPAAFKQIVDNAVSQSPGQQKAAEEERVATIRAQGKPPEGELPLPNVAQMNAGLTSRYQVLNPNKPLPPQFTLPANATQKDYDRIDKLMQSTENATATKAQRDQANAAGLQLTKAALDQQAENYWNTGKLPPAGRGAAGIIQNRQIMNRAAELHAGESLAAGSGEYKANVASLTGIQKNLDAVTAFENTANKNLDLFTNLAQKAIDTGIPLLNRPLRAGAAELGSQDQAALNAARQVAVNEIAKVTSSPGLTGQLSDSARHEIEAFNPASATYGQTLAVAKVLKQDMANRHQSYADQIAQIKNRIGDTKATAETSGGAAAAPAPATGTNHPFFAKYGGTALPKTP